MVEIKLDGVVESLIISRLDELSVKTITHPQSRISYQGNIEGFVDSSSFGESEFYLQGKHLLHARYNPSAFRILKNGSEVEQPASEPLYVSSLGSLVYYVMNGIRSNDSLPIFFWRCLKEKKPGCLASFDEFVKGYMEDSEDSKNSFWAGIHIGNAKDKGGAKLPEAFNSLATFLTFLTPEAIEDKIFIHDSEYHPVKSLKISAGNLKATKDWGFENYARSSSERLGGYETALDLTGDATFQPPLTGELLQVSGLLKVKPRKGIARRGKTEYRLKGDWEPVFEGRADLRICQPCYWKGVAATNSELCIKAEGELI